MLKIVRGMVAVLVLVIVVTAIYFVVQNYKNVRLAEEENLKQVQTKTQKQLQQGEAKFQAEKRKVDALVNTMENHSNQINTSHKEGSPF